MPLYRTNSDRGLWKKYRKEQPQHFHKPCYLDTKKPQVTYSQLDLGEGYRINSSRQSNPNIGDDFAGAAATSENRYRNFKSAPTTPRATTPTRLRSRNRDMMQYGGDQAANSNGLTNGHQSRPVTATSIYSQESGYPDENASSTWDSRSLGRDSALGPYMASSNHHATRGNNGFHGAADTPDRPNPFHQGSNIAPWSPSIIL